MGSASGPRSAGNEVRLPIVETMRHHWRQVVLAGLCFANIGAIFYALFTFSVTYVCNARCRTCNVWKKRVDDLTLPEYERLYRRRAYLPAEATKPVRERVQELARRHGIRDRRAVKLAPPEDQGVIITQILPSSPAAQSGLKVNDVITKINTQQIDGTHPISSILLHTRPGDKVTLTIIRDGKQQTVDLTLGRQS